MMDSNFQFQALLFWWLASRGKCFWCKQQSLLLVIVRRNNRLYHCPHPQFTRRGHGLVLCRHFLSQNCKTSIKISAVCTRIVVSPFIPEPWTKYTTSSDIHSNQCDKLWTDFHLSITVSFVMSSMIYVRIYLVSTLAWIQWEIMNFPLRMLTWYKSLSSFPFCEDRASDPQGKSYEAGGLIVLFNRSVITISPWLAMQTNYWYGVS